MVQAVAYECDLCHKLTKDIFGLTVESIIHYFSIGDSIDQPRVNLSVCCGCLADIGKVLTNGLH
jgi:hypothetical protein